MSEPMTSAEIEDVLSSIRRLVSEELRGGAESVPVAAMSAGAVPVSSVLSQASPSPAVQPASGAGKAGTGEGRPSPMIRRAEDAQRPARLLLTPALRVVADRAEEGLPAGTADTPSDPHAAEAAGQDRGLHDPLNLDAVGLGDRVAALGAAVGAQGDEWEPDHAAPDSEVPEAGFWSDDHETDWSVDPAADQVGADPIEADWASTRPTAEFLTFPRLHLSAIGASEGPAGTPVPTAVADDVTAAPRAAADDVPAGEEKARDTFLLLAPVDAVADDTQALAGDRMARDFGGTDEVLSDGTVSPAEVLSDATADVVPDADAEGDAIPGGGHEDEVPGWAQQAADDFAEAPDAADPAETEVLAEEVLGAEAGDWLPEQAAAFPDIFADAGYPAADPFDEDRLREMVRDLIREELQGPLGERITRNIRKLVRAEIARAMTLRDLD